MARIFSLSPGSDYSESAVQCPRSAPPAPTGNQEMLAELRSSLRPQYTTRQGFCGGEISVQPTSGPSDPNGDPNGVILAGTGTILLRFDKVDGSVSKLQLPPAKSSKSTFQELFQACSSLGSERDVGELNSTHFSLDFHPADHGIVDTVAQVLLAAVKKHRTEGKVDDMMFGRAEHWGVKVRLGKLVISVPPTSSKVSERKLDVAPMGDMHFGTLIICLPVPHEGGDMLLKHNNQSTHFSTSTPTTITWAAFTHNFVPFLVPLTSGHLILITYELFLTPSIGLPLEHVPSADPSLYPLYNTMSTILSHPDFLPHGGILGFYLEESSLSHTRRNVTSHLPHSLKGVDLMFFAVCTSLGLKACVKPVLGDEAWDEHAEGKIWGTEEEVNEEVDSDVTRVGQNFERIKMADVVWRSDEDPTPFIDRYFPLQELQDVTWLNEAHHEGWEIQLVHRKHSPPFPAYSSSSSSTPTHQSEENEKEVSLMWHYTHPAILVNVPPTRQREGLKVTKVFPDWRKEREREEGKTKFKIVVEDYS